MGWGRMLLLGNLGQQLDIRDQQQQISDLQEQLRRMRSQGQPSGSPDRVIALEREVDELRLYLAALVQYLGAKGALDRAEFVRLVDAIDGQDGEADGAYRGRI